MANKYVLDSSALIAFLWDEPGAQVVEDILVDEDAEVFMSTISLGEVLYIVHRLVGEQAAAAVESKVLETPRLRLVDATWPRVKQAANLKADGGLSLAGGFGGSDKEPGLDGKTCRVRGNAS